MQPQDRVRGERRPVTALFVDVVGSTSLAESLGPEDWATTMEHAVAVMTEAVERYDGWVASHTGDGFMALFGLPSAHDDDPARAVSSALEMVSGIDAAAGALRGSGVDFQVRVGINTGEVVVRDSASGGETQTSRLYGDTLNVAARMQAEAPPGGIMITGETHAQVGGAVSTRHVGAMTVKGRSVPVEAYEVLGRSGSLRSVRGIAGLHSPMVGRDAELAQLTNALAPVRAGVARMALVVGEPGIGKSRLLAELHRVSEADSFAWVEARTVSYGRNLPQHLAVDLVRALIGLPDPLESISADEASDRLSDCLRDLDGVDEAVLGPILRHLLSLPLDADAAEQVAHMEPVTLRLRYTETISMLVRAMARSKPMVIVCDDVHWADEASVDLLQPLVATLAAEPVLWVLASRAERDVPGWRLVNAAEEAYGDALIELRLRALDADDGQRLVAHLLAIESLPPATRAAILDRAEGNPLFVEEIIRMLIDQEAIVLVEGSWMARSEVVDIEIPETLHGLLLARIDRLPTEAGRVLRVAGVVGRTFAVRVLDHVGAASLSIPEGQRGTGRELRLLEGAGLITLAAAVSEPEYLFHHALIQDAAYASLLKEERRSLHARVADALLDLYPERREDLAPTLAHHFERAEDRDRSLEYLALAGRHAYARFARHEAVDFARRAIAIMDDGDVLDAADRRRRAELRLLQGEAGIDFVPLSESLPLFDAVIADGEALGDPELTARAYLAIGGVRALSGEQYGTSPELTTALQRATELAESSGSNELAALATLRTAQSRFIASEFPEAIGLMDRAIPALIDAERFYDASVAAGQLGASYGHVGEFDKAIHWTDRAFELGQASGDPNAALDADLMRSIVEAIRGDTTASIEYATRAADEADRVDNKACAMVAHTVIGEQHLQEGDAERAAIAFESSSELATYCQFMPVKIEQTELLLRTARARSGTGRVDFDRYDNALELARRFGDRLAEAQLYEQRARDRIEAGHEDGAVDDLADAMARFEVLGATADLRRAAGLRSSLHPATIDPA